MSRSFRHAARLAQRRRSPRPSAASRPSASARRCAPASAGWSSSRSPPGAQPSRSATRTTASCTAAAWQPSGIRASTSAASAGASGADTFSVNRENSSLVRPMSKASTSNAPPRSMTASKMRGQQRRVDQMPLGGDDGGRCGSAGHGLPKPYLINGANERQRVSHAHGARRRSGARGACRGVRGAKPLGRSMLAEDSQKPLRDDVRRLGTLLGETLVRQEGEDLYQRVERVRACAKDARRGPTGRFDETFHDLTEELASMPIDAARAGRAGVLAVPAPGERRGGAPPGAAPARRTSSIRSPGPSRTRSRTTLPRLARGGVSRRGCARRCSGSGSSW